MNTQIPIHEPLGEVLFEAEMKRRELNNSENKALAFIMEDDEYPYGLGLNELIYQDITILV